MIFSDIKKNFIFVLVSVLLLGGVTLVSHTTIFLFNSMFVLTVSYLAWKTITFTIEEFKVKTKEERNHFIFRLAGYLILLFIVIVYF